MWRLIFILFFSKYFYDIYSLNQYLKDMFTKVDSAKYLSIFAF